jgi:chromosome partitioning protein
MAVVTTANLKGGVGKTSCCLHIAGALALLGRRVLLVDNDPQSSLTSGFFGPQAPYALDPRASIAAVYGGDDPRPVTLVRPSGFDGIDLVPGSPHAGSYNVPDPHKTPHADQVRLRDFIDQVRGDYDVILIDNPPNLYLATWAAMAASDAVLVPVMPENFGAQGTGEVIASASMVQAVVNPGLRLAGYVVSMYQARRAVHRLYVDELRQAHGNQVFAAMIPESVDYVEAVTALKPVGMLKPRGTAAKAIRAVAEELVQRLAAPAAEVEEAA